ncbi:MAG: hypothetical protein NVV73_06085 [Cellvibrionaceae bacterium]|nr:hypothetical protein [Cellvibrionaceae bacterium]
MIAGLILAAPIVRYSSSITLGKLTHRLGLFLCPSETAEVPVLRDLAKILPEAAAVPVGKMEIPPLPNEIWREMPTQSFDDWRPNSRATKLRATKGRRTLISSRT